MSTLTAHTFNPYEYTNHLICLRAVLHILRPHITRETFLRAIKTETQPEAFSVLRRISQSQSLCQILCPESHLEQRLDQWVRENSRD